MVAHISEPAELDSRIERAHGIDKIERYKWQTKDKKGSFLYIVKTDLKIDHLHYQRDNISHEKILDLARNWSWVACGTISVARRADKSLWVMDGQYRLMAALRRSDIKDLPCMIFDVDDIKDEAEGFLNVNINRKAMRYLDRFKALNTSGDEAASFVQELIASTGRIAGVGHGKEVRCVGSLVSGAQKQRDALKRIWPLLNALSSDEPIPSQIVDGLMFLEVAMQPDVSLSVPTISRRLITIGSQELLIAARASAHFRGKGGAKIWADGICQRYNKGLQYKLPVPKDVLSF